MSFHCHLGPQWGCIVNFSEYIFFHNWSKKFPREKLSFYLCIPFPVKYEYCIPFYRNLQSILLFSKVYEY